MTVRKQISFLLCVFCFFHAKAQVNLVPNPSFENYYLCPSGWRSIPLAPDTLFYTALYWVSANNGSPDYFNPCASSTPLDIRTPINFVGNQVAHTGNAYCGLYTFELGVDYSEILECRLLEPLKLGTSYYVSFYVSRSDTARYASSKLGVYFSNTMVYRDTFGVYMHLSPGVVSPPNVYYTDTAGWTKVGGFYNAKGGEEWMLIGRFYDTTPPLRMDTGAISISIWAMAYYYIDDVSVIDSLEPDTYITTPNPTPTHVIGVPSAFSPNGDGVNDVLYVRGENISSVQLKIYDRWGHVVFYTENIQTGWDGKFNGQPQSQESYTYILKATFSDGVSITKKGAITLLR